MKNKESIKIIILVGLMVIVLVALGAFFSFAYFAADTDINNTLPLDVSIEDGIPLNFTATGNDDITVNVSGDSMLNDSVGSVAGTGNTSITLSLDTTMNAFCTYDLVWMWDSTSPNQYTKTNSSSNEFTISGTNGTQSLSETQVSNYNDTLKLGTYTIEANNTVVTQTWNFTAKFYNINANQDAHAGAIYKGKIVVENAMCEKNTLSDAVLALEQSEDYTSAQDGTIYRVVNQNGVRYEGKDPNNYVWYNCTDENDTSTCERWRIIGVFDGADIGLESGKKYTKIIKSTPIANMAWDSTSPYENDWVNSTLYQYLNGTYLTNTLSSSAQGKIAKYNNQYSTWYLLGPTGEEFGNYYTPDMYRAERDIAVGHKGYSNGEADSADPSIPAAIGLMYPSDYGYAAYGSSCNNESTDTLYYYETTCAAADWLMYYDDAAGYHYEWTISPLASNSNFAFDVLGSVGGSVDYVGVHRGYAVRPVLYLEASVEKKDGQGTYELPYVLS